MWGWGSGSRWINVFWRSVQPQLNLQGDILKLIFLFSLLLGLGKTYRHIITLKIWLTSFHFKIYQFLTWKKILEFVFIPVTWTSIFMDFLQNILNIFENLNSILLLLSFLDLYTLQAYFLYTEQWYANSKVNLKWLMSEKGQKWFSHICSCCLTNLDNWLQGLTKQFPGHFQILGISNKPCE